MKTASFNTDLNFDNDKVLAQLITETPFSKEMRITMKTGQSMKEHKAPKPIILHLLSGSVNFGMEGKIIQLEMGDIISLEANVSHDLLANSDSVIRLSLSKGDEALRVENVAEKSD